ncbi:MAG TPA: dihydropteroate synthase [Acidobacteriota bacterium]|nr:dihydropteroate synthase [Acidobacteriota bacterium]
MNSSIADFEVFERREYLFRAGDREIELGRRTCLMGIVNITPDSFSDGGRFLETSAAIDRCLELESQGVDIVDLGAESSRPGAEPVSMETELKRLLPVLEAIRPQLRAMISVDTCKSGVAREVLEAGADIINDISALRFDPEMGEVVSEYRAGLILMHMRGTPATMQQLPPSPNILAEIRQDLQIAVDKAHNAGIARDRLVLDPGIGFGKTVEDNLKIINRLETFADFQLPIMVGTSRKSFIGKILDQPPDERLIGTVASSVAAVMRGAHIIRVHDVVELKQAVAIVDSILAEKIL